MPEQKTSHAPPMGGQMGALTNYNLAQTTIATTTRTTTTNISHHVASDRVKRFTIHPNRSRHQMASPTAAAAPSFWCIRVYLHSARTLKDIN